MVLTSETSIWESPTYNLCYGFIAMHFYTESFGSKLDSNPRGSSRCPNMLGTTEPSMLQKV